MHGIIKLKDLLYYMYASIHIYTYAPQLPTVALRELSFPFGARQNTLQLFS